MRSKQAREEMIPKSTLRASAQVLSFLKTRLGYGDEEILAAAQVWGKKNHRKRHKEVTQIDMIEAIEEIILKGR